MPRTAPVPQPPKVEELAREAAALGSPDAVAACCDAVARERAAQLSEEAVADLCAIAGALFLKCELAGFTPLLIELTDLLHLAGKRVVPENLAAALRLHLAACARKTTTH
jgi:hypothetical protein